MLIGVMNFMDSGVPGAWPGMEALYWVQNGKLLKNITRNVQFPSAVSLANLITKNPYSEKFLSAEKDAIVKQTNDLLDGLYVPSICTPQPPWGMQIPQGR